MTAALTAERSRLYALGAVDFKTANQRNWALGLSIAISIHCAVIGSYYLMGLIRSEGPPIVTPRIISYLELGPPPSIANINAPPPVALRTPTARPTGGIPVPIPDLQVKAPQLYPTQTEMDPIEGPLSGPGVPGAIIVPPDNTLDRDAPPIDFQSVEKKPVLVRSVQPAYPELAVRAGLEGTVVVKILVDKEGKARQVLIEKSDAEIFDQSALDAAKQLVFTPAYMNYGPVSVWVKVPFHFKLANGK